ncbi:hypothetical protein FEAC_20080 [Ferrimicrobium acidiphilum DSM 19497]|uniref:Uncharacterized protein n=1 Tax=Ferrimicrobium acidiphilum DSM 19497 TaxID=1121877 RepID=A0A0D8FSM2_9ACTN|nr:hypothetical protein FEAC_20080 [Ferrimicrobium acidiphilum DSM 19497]
MGMPAIVADGSYERQDYVGQVLYEVALRHNRDSQRDDPHELIKKIYSQSLLRGFDQLHPKKGYENMHERANGDCIRERTKANLSAQQPSC